MRPTKGSAVTAASMLPPLSTSPICGSGTSMKVTRFGSTPFSVSQRRTSTCSVPPRPGTPNFLPTRSCAVLIAAAGRATMLT